MRADTPLFLRLITVVVASLPFAPRAEILEPWVQRVERLFSPELCQRIIERAEEIGFPDTADSIDYDDDEGSVSWAIDVEDDGEIFFPELADLYAHVRPIMDGLVASAKKKWLDDKSPPSLDWVFVRKYEANSKRQMLSLHNDINLFTVNVALNDDYEGGGLFYHKPESTWGYAESNGIVPAMPDEYQSYDYLRENVKGGVNTTKLIFPKMATGDAVIYNFSLYHAVAPIQARTRYSIVFFYDQHHPVVKTFDSHDVSIVLINYFEEPVALFWIDDEFVERTRTLVMKDLPKYPQVLRLTTTSDYAFDVISMATGRVMDTFSAPDGPESVQYVFEMEEVNPDSDTCLEDPDDELCLRASELADMVPMDPVIQQELFADESYDHDFILKVETIDDATDKFIDEL